MLIYILVNLLLRHNEVNYSRVPRHEYAPESLAQELRQWLGNLGTGTLYVKPGSPWENGYCESFNGKLREECLNGEIFYSLREARIVIEQWRQQYNRVRPPAALGYRPPRRRGPIAQPGTRFHDSRW